MDVISLCTVPVYTADGSVTFDGAFKLFHSCDEPRTILFTVLGEGRVTKHKFGLGFSGGDKIDVGMLDVAAVPGDVPHLLTPLSSMTRKIVTVRSSHTTSTTTTATTTTTSDTASSKPETKVDVLWVTGTGDDKEQLTVGDAEPLTDFPPSATLAVTMFKPGTCLTLHLPEAPYIHIPTPLITFPAYRGRVRFHPAFKPRHTTIAMDSASCSSGPETVVFWGLPPDTKTSFRVETVGAMNSLGMAALKPGLVRTDVRKVSKFVCGGSGKDSDYADPRWHTDISGTLSIEVDYPLRMLTVRSPSLSAPIVIHSFPPTHGLAITLYASSTVHILDGGTPTPSRLSSLTTPTKVSCRK